MKTGIFHTVILGKESFTPIEYNADKFVMDWTMEAAGKVPEHIHEYSDEHFVVTKGIVSFKVGGKFIVKKSGDELFVPKGIPHSIVNTTGSQIALRVTYTPCADVHRMFEILTELNTKSPGSAVNMMRYFYIYPRLGLKPFSTIPSPFIMSLLHGFVTITGKLSGWDKLVNQFR